MLKSFNRFLASALVPCVLLGGLPMGAQAAIRESDGDETFAELPRSPADQGVSGAFGRSYYKVITQEATWTEAAGYCALDGGYLVTISSAEENQFVYELLPGDRHGAWLGGSDVETEGTWTWVTGEPFD